jgi:hypothetical protein
MTRPHASDAIVELRESDTREPQKRRFVGLLRRGGPGRPTAEVTKAGLECIERMAAAGHCDQSISKALGCSKRTLANMKVHDERIQEALDRGRASLEDELSDILLDIARNKTHKMQAVAAIYLTKARCGWVEGQAPQQRPNVTIVLPDSQSPADYMRSITVQHNPAKGVLPE